MNQASRVVPGHKCHLLTSYRVYHVYIYTDYSMMIYDDIWGIYEVYIYIYVLKYYNLTVHGPFQNEFSLNPSHLPGATKRPVQTVQDFGCLASLSFSCMGETQLKWEICKKVNVEFRNVAYSFELKQFSRYLLHLFIKLLVLKSNSYVPRLSNIAIQSCAAATVPTAWFCCQQNKHGPKLANCVLTLFLYPANVVCRILCA